jgi:AcrR family transcriptional regulator
MNHENVICAFYIRLRYKEKVMPKTNKTPPRTGYHHGNLRQALIDATIQLVEEGGPESVSVREAAKRAGVSPGAPFRHFNSKTSLMTAVAEQAMSHFRSEITNAVEQLASNDPIGRFAAIGAAYLRWAFQNPTHFQIISTRNLLDWNGSEPLRRDNDAVRALLEDSMVEAQNRGMLRSNNIIETQIAARALVYGLARMHIDGHFAQWAEIGQTGEQTAQNVLSHFVTLVANGTPKTGNKADVT